MFEELRPPSEGPVALAAGQGLDAVVSLFVNVQACLRSEAFLTLFALELAFSRVNGRVFRQARFGAELFAAHLTLVVFSSFVEVFHVIEVARCRCIHLGADGAHARSFGIVLATCFFGCVTITEINII